MLSLAWWQALFATQVFALLALFVWTLLDLHRSRVLAGSSSATASEAAVA